MNINRVAPTGNLTADPELRALPSGSSVGRLRLAVNTRRKIGQTGEWEEKANFFTVTEWGAQAESCAQYLAKGGRSRSTGAWSGAPTRPRTAEA